MLPPRMAVVLDVGVASLAGVLQALAALLLIAALAFLALRLVRAGRLGRETGQLAVEARLPLDLRNALLIVRIEQRRFVIATGEHGPARMITELPPAPHAATAPATSLPARGDGEPT